jgi:hypothetical protein
MPNGTRFARASTLNYIAKYFAKRGDITPAQAMDQIKKARAERVEVVKEREFSSSFGPAFEDYIAFNLRAGFAASAIPKPGGGGWIVRILRLTGGAS